MNNQFTLAKESIKPIDHWFGFLFFSLMFGMAWVFFQERIGYLDSATYTLEMIKFDYFAIAHDRWGAGASQIIPLILLYSGASLKAVMIGYSVNFILLYFTCFCFCLYICRHRYAAYTICLFLVFSVKYTFFWPVSEIFQAMVYSISFFAWWNSDRTRSPILHYLIAIALVILTLSTHSAASISLGFAFVYDLLSRPNPWNTKYLVRSGIALGVTLLFVLLRKNDSYEESHIGAVLEFHKFLPYLLESKGLSVFWSHFSENYRILAYGLMLILVSLLLQKKWLQLGTVLAFHLVYALILLSAYPFGAIKIMAENLFFPIALCQTLVLCGDVLFSKDRFYLPQIGIAIFIYAFFLRIEDIKWTYLDKTRHYQTLSNNLKGSPDRKLLFLSHNHPHDFTMFTWPSFAESLLFSGLEGPDECFTVYVAQDWELERIREYHPASDLFLAYSWDPISTQSELPKEYFNLPDQPYKMVNPYRPIPPDSFLNLTTHMRMEWVDQYSTLPAGQRRLVNIRFHNQNPDPIPSNRSLPASVFISYRFYNEGELIDWRPAPSPLLMDIDSELEQLILLEVPQQHGPLEIQFGLVGHHGDTMYLTTDRYPINIGNKAEKR